MEKCEIERLRRDIKDATDAWNVRDFMSWSDVARALHHLFETMDQFEERLEALEGEFEAKEGV